MKVSAMAASLAASTMLVGAVVTGCGSDKSSSPSSSSHRPRRLLPRRRRRRHRHRAPVLPSLGTTAACLSTDIVVPNDTFTLAQTLPVPNPAGVEGVHESGRLSQNRRHDLSLSRRRRGAHALDQSAKAIPELGVKATPTPADAAPRPGS